MTLGVKARKRRVSALSRMTRHPDIGRISCGSVPMTLPGETETALRGRSHC